MMRGKTIFLALLASSMLAGCFGSEHEDLHEWIGVQKSMAKPRVQPLKEPSVFLPQAYEASTEMDPFNMLKLTQVLRRETEKNTANTALLTAEQNRRKEELESYPLDSVTMVGSLKKGNQRIALLRVNQLIYRVGVGNYLGQNYGRIVQIEENSIKLREVVQDAAGDWVERMATLDLQEGGN